MKLLLPSRYPSVFRRSSGLASDNAPPLHSNTAAGESCQLGDRCSKEHHQPDSLEQVHGLHLRLDLIILPGLLRAGLKSLGDGLTPLPGLDAGSSVGQSGASFRPSFLRSWGLVRRGLQHPSALLTPASSQEPLLSSPLPNPLLHFCFSHLAKPCNRTTCISQWHHLYQP